MNRSQVAFLAFLVGHSLSAFKQWKALLTLMLTCEEAPLRTHPDLFIHLLATLHAQVCMTVKLLTNKSL